MVLISQSTTLPLPKKRVRSSLLPWYNHLYSAPFWLHTKAESRGREKIRGIVISPRLLTVISTHYFFLYFTCSSHQFTVWRLVSSYKQLKRSRTPKGFPPSRSPYPRFKTLIPVYPPPRCERSLYGPSSHAWAGEKSCERCAFGRGCRKRLVLVAAVVVGRRRRQRRW